MPRRIVYSLVFLAATAGLVWATWSGAAANPATLINRVDVIVAVVMLAGLPWLARRVFGPVGDSWFARIVRVGGYAAVFALVLVKANVERSEYAGHSGRAWLAGVWAGEIIFLVVIAAYVAGLLVVTARRPPFSPVALAIGGGGGVAAGLLMYALPPVGRWPHITIGWLAVMYGVARTLALPLALGAAIAAGLVAARTSPGPRPRMAAGAPVTITSPPFSVATCMSSRSAQDPRLPGMSQRRHRVTLRRSRPAFPDRPPGCRRREPREAQARARVECWSRGRAIPRIQRSAAGEDPYGAGAQEGQDSGDAAVIAGHCVTSDSLIS